MYLPVESLDRRALANSRASVSISGHRMVLLSSLSTEEIIRVDAFCERSILFIEAIEILFEGWRAKAKATPHSVQPSLAPCASKTRSDFLLTATYVYPFPLLKVKSFISWWSFKRKRVAWVWGDSELDETQFQGGHSCSFARFLLDGDCNPAFWKGADPNLEHPKPHDRKRQNAGIL